MDPNNNGTQPNAELGQQATQQTTELATQQTPAVAGAPDSQAAVQPNAELEALRTQLAEEQKARQLAEQQARDHQAGFTQARQQLKALAGVQPQADPIKPYLDKVCKEFGLSPDDPPAIAMANRDMEHQNQIRSIMQMQGQSQVGLAINQAFSMDPAVFSDPEVAKEVQGILSQNALNGDLQSINPETSLNLAYMIAGRRAMAARTANPAARANPQGQPPQFNINGIYSTAGGFQPPQQKQQQASQPTPEQLQLRAELEARMKGNA